MPPPVLQRRMSMPMLHGAQLEQAQQEQQQAHQEEEPQPRSLAAAGRTPTMDSIRAARRRASTVVSNNGSPSTGQSGGEDGQRGSDGDRSSGMAPHGVALGDAEVRPPSRVASSVASAPPVAPAKVLVKRRKSLPGAGPEAPSAPHRVDPTPPPPPPPPPPSQPAVSGGSDGGGDSQWRGSEDIVPLVLRDAAAPRPAHSRTSSTTRSDVSGGRSQPASAQNTIELNQPASRGAADASSSEHWGTSVSHHHQDSFTDASESLTRRLAQQFEAPPSAPPPPPPPPPNWKVGDTPRSGGGDAPLPPSVAPLPPPPKRVSQFVVDEAPLPAANDVKARVEQMQAAEWARIEEERLQQPGRQSFTTASRLDFSSRKSPRDYDDGQYSYVTEDTGEEAAHHEVEEAPRTGGMADFANAVSAAARGLNSSARAPPAQTTTNGRNTSPQERSRGGAASSSPPSSFVRTAPITFAMELDGVSVVLYHQLSENSQLKINAELANIVFDAVRGPVHRLDMVRVEHIAVSEESDSRAIVEGTIRGARNAADRRLAIRLLVSFLRGPSSAVIGQRLVQFPSLVRDAPSVVVRRMYVNDVDVFLIPTAATGASASGLSGGGESNTPGSVAAFEARRAKLKMATTPSVTAASFREDGTPRNLSPGRYPDRAIYHHISTPAGQQAQRSHNDASTIQPIVHAGGGGTELSVFHSPSNGFGVTRYRTRKYEYH